MTDHLNKSVLLINFLQRKMLDLLEMANKYGHELNDFTRNSKQTHELWCERLVRIYFSLKKEDIANESHSVCKAVEKLVRRVSGQNRMPKTTLQCKATQTDDSHENEDRRSTELLHSPSPYELPNVRLSSSFEIPLDSAEQRRVALSRANDMSLHKSESSYSLYSSQKKEDQDLTYKTSSSLELAQSQLALNTKSNRLPVLTQWPPMHTQSQQSQRSRSRNEDGKNTMLVSNYYSMLMGPKDNKTRDIIKDKCNIWKPNVKVVKSERGRHAELVENGKL